MELTDFNLEDNTLGDEATEAINMFLELNIELTSLYLSCNRSSKAVYFYKT